MKEKVLKNGKVYLVLIVLMVLLMIIISSSIQTTKKTNNLGEEIARSMTYPQVEEGEEETDSEFVKFDAFFLRDLDGDGYAESIRGTCKEIGQSDTLYMELNVLTNGYLKDAKIEVNSDKNYYLQTAIVKDTEVKQNYIGNNVNKIEFNNITNGTQKLLTAVVRSGDYTYTSMKAEAIGNNINNYSKINSITLTGTHVEEKEDGTTIETPIEKNVEFNVDWHGSTKTQISNIRQAKDIAEVVDEENQEIKIEFMMSTNEVNKQLRLKKSYIEGTIPQLNGYNPKKVEITGINVTYTYNEKSKQFTAQREAIVDKNGKIVTSANSGSWSNEYKIKVTYPLEAYDKLGGDAIEYKLPVKAYYEGYNNTNKEFKNPYRSNIAQDIYVITYRKPQGRVARFDVRVGKYVTGHGMIVSKQKPLNIYKGMSAEEKNDIYNVRWDVYTGSDGQDKKVLMKETEGAGEKTSDRFIKADSNTESMQDITKNIGIYFSDPVNILGEDGEIRVYDDETDQLIETFNKNNWNNYSQAKPYKYEIPIKHIRIETSNVNANSNISIYNVKELEDLKITNKYSKEEFDNLKYIQSTLAGYLGEEHINTDIEQAKYEEMVSIASLNISEKTITTQETQKNVIIKIKTESDENDNEAKWTNGAFLLKLPEDIIDVEINSININNSNVKITNYEIYEKNGERFIKINTENEKSTSYTITLKCDITPDPRVVTKTEYIELYAYNENNSNYYYSSEDQYDVNDNLNKEEKVNKRTVALTFVSPNTLITSQIAKKYDTKGSEIIAPQVALVTKEQRKATIGINITNNYSSTISEVKILGKIPFVGNTYILNGNNMESSFNTTMSDEGIQLPQELQGIAKIYYSTKENPTKDLTNDENDWNTSPADFSQVKSYLIDLEDKILAKGETHEISYEINIPTGINNNQISYSHHAVYFSLDTENGKYKTQTEPNKLGFMVAKLYDLELTKYHKGLSKLIPGATYKIQVDGEDIGKTKVTGEDGKLTFNNLYAEKTYTIQEIKSPNEYELNDDTIKFTIKEENGKLIVQKLEGTTKKIETVKEEGQEDKVKIDVEDEVKASLKIKKVIQGTDNGIENIKYRITGKGLANSGRILTTNADGEITLKGLYIGKEYTLEEIKAEGYYIENPIKFTVVNNDGNYEVNIIEGIVKLNTVTNDDEIPTITLKIENEKIPEYDLVINKVVKDETTPLPGVKFALYKGQERQDAYITDDNGRIEISGLYQYVESRKIDQVYTLKEVMAPDGYSKVEDITFYVDKQEGLLNMHVTKGSVKDITVENTTVTITIENEPAFKLIKKDGKIKELLPGVKFAIFDNQTGKPATDSKGNILGTREIIDGKTYYVVITNEKGEITADLPKGLYRAVEVETYEQYDLGTIDDRTYYFGIDMSQDEVLKKEAIWGTGIPCVNSVEATSDGGYIVGGYFYDEKIKIGEDELVNKSITGDENYIYGLMSDAMIIKYDENNEVEWARGVGGEYNDYISSVTETKDGEYIAVGHFVSRNVEVGEYNFGNEYNGDKVLIIKYDSTGEVEWATQLSMMGGHWDISLNVISTDDDGYMVSGYFSSAISIGDCFIDADSIDGILIKYDSNNEIEWIQTVGGIADDIIIGVAQIKDGGYIVAGNFDSEKIELGSYILSNGTNNRLANKGMLIKYNSEGKVEWATSIGEKIDYFEEISSVEATNDGGYIILKYDHEDLNNMLIKYNVKNEIEWTKLLEIDGNYGIDTIKQTSDGGYLLVGTSGKVYNTWETNSVIIKCNANGEIEWEKNVQSADDYSILNVKSISEKINRNYIIGGYSGTDKVKVGEINIDLGSTSGGMLIEMGNVVEEPSIPETREIVVDNNLKQLKITTEVELVDGVKGGSISGEKEKPYEIVEYGNNSIKEIKMIPDAGYEIVDITINGENVDFDKESDGSYILPKITNMIEDKHIVVRYIQTSKKLPQIIVHHYIKGTTTRLAPDERYTGELNSNYVTKPHLGLEDYELIKDETGEYILPTNASRKIC